MKPADKAWFWLGGYALFYDVYALVFGHETLSAGFWRHQGTRKFWKLFWVALSWHLLFGDRTFLPEHHHVRLRAVHPFWQAHEGLVRVGERYVQR